MYMLEAFSNGPSRDDVTVKCTVKSASAAMFVSLYMYMHTSAETT